MMVSSLIFTLARERDLLVKTSTNVRGVVLYYGTSFIPYILTVVHANVAEIEDWKSFYYLGIYWVYDEHMDDEEIKFKLVYGANHNA